MTLCLLFYPLEFAKVDFIFAESSPVDARERLFAGFSLGFEVWILQVKHF